MPSQRLAFVIVLTLAIIFSVRDNGAQTGDASDPLHTKRHFKIERPRDLSKAEAMTAYDTIADLLARGYAASANPTAGKYRTWRRYNDAPYRSASHGNRYVNNYANARAARYGELKRGERMPAGAILAKDSFTVTADNDVFGGALFIMEKLPPGRSPESADWRYAMIMPDGSLFGDSAGQDAEKVAFCHRCHRAVAETDHLFFIPQDYRRQFRTDD